ncbi:hypothetical protein QRD02_00115 [Aequorivita sp. SDUM287046]|uniref:DUF4432 family protein n=1 Tax=Aequorivita aurantiaca TaxID=3053356 RepID=A0ABT8DE15_9FLAO|nr:hypothetical protein [Aequorivita aurantiaca]MDN3722769.1 hypothetical protein [Aequorivita aurantiaca]
MSLFTDTHYTLKKKDNAIILIEPCQRFDSPLTMTNNTFEFKELGTTNKFGWNGGDQIIMDIDLQTNIVSFANPFNINHPIKLKLLHPDNSIPGPGIKTYYDETEGGFSKARILVTDNNEISTGNCFIHSNVTQIENDIITGSYRGMYDENFSAILNPDNTGTFLGLPMQWSIVSDHIGELKKWSYYDGGFLIHLMIEFDGPLPKFIDPVTAGKKVAMITGLIYSKSEGTVELYQMMKQ